MRQSSLRATLAAGQPVFGLLSGNVEPMLVETLGLVGFDFYLLDTEHGTGSPGEAAGVVRACEAVGIAPLARVRSLDPKLILQFLDAGIEGVMLPGVRGAEDVRQFVDAMKYPPAGRRGIAAVRANDWLLGPRPQAEWVRLANEMTLVLPQVETREALEALPELVKVPGVDGFIIGPRDLSMAMGFPDGPAHPEVEQAIDRITKTVLDAGLLVGTVAPTPERAKALLAKGHRILLHSVNALLKTGADAFFRGARG
jgi:4-hydroxy-2-oxoheptanedioate aldolase